MFKDNLVRRWKEAATLIIAARNSASSRCDYSVLMLRRLETSSFAAKMNAFPGGLLDKSDSSRSWLDLFSPFSRGDSSVVDFLRKSACCSLDNGPPTFATKRPEDWALPAEVTFKICALRETFEETGILLVRRLDQAPGKAWERPSFASNHVLESGMLEEWTARVRADASCFTELCRSLNCVPDIWSLHLWSSWLTPSNSPKRYDTPFFIACMDDQPSVAFNQTEHSSFAWINPASAETMVRAGELAIGPPQLIELCRLESHCQLDSLCRFSEQRAKEHGAERWSPVRLRCTDAWLSVLPGDSIYGNYLSGEEVDMTAAELLEGSAARHVLVMSRPRHFRFSVNVPERRGHYHPVIGEGCVASKI